MRKPLLTLAAAAGLLAAGSLANRADALPLGNPDGMRAASENIAVTDQIHCRPYRLHHNWWRGRPHWDGCVRHRYRRAPIVVVPPFIVPRHRYYSYGYYPRRHWRGRW